MGALKSKMWDDYVEQRVRETQRREIAAAVIADYFGPNLPAAKGDEIEGVFVIDHLLKEGLVLGHQRNDELSLARVRVPSFLRHLLREGDSYFFRLRRVGEDLLTEWMGGPWLT